MLVVTLGTGALVGCTSNTIVPEDGSTGMIDPSETDASIDGTTVTPPDTTGPEPTMGPTTGPAATEGTTTGEPDRCAFPQPGAIECSGPGMGTMTFAVTSNGGIVKGPPLDEGCTITAVMGSQLELDCPSQPITIEVVSVPAQSFEVGTGTAVDLTYWEDYEDEINIARFVTVRYAMGGTLLFAAIDASEPPDPVQADLSPLVLSTPPTTCSTFPTECVDAQDAALRVEYDGDSVDVFTGQDAFVGQLTSYRVLTDRVERIHCFPDDCGYNYAEWVVQAAFFQIPEG